MSQRKWGGAGFLSQGREGMLESRCVIIKYFQGIICIDVFYAFIYFFLTHHIFAMMVFCLKRCWKLDYVFCK